MFFCLVSCPAVPLPPRSTTVPFSSFIDYVRALLIGSTALTRCGFRSAYFGEPLSGSLTLPSVRSSSLTSALSVAASGEWAYVRLERSPGALARDPLPLRAGQLRFLDSPHLPGYG